MGDQASPFLFNFYSREADLILQACTLKIYEIIQVSISSGTKLNVITYNVDINVIGDASLISSLRHWVCGSFVLPYTHVTFVCRACQAREGAGKKAKKSHHGAPGAQHVH